WPVNNTTYTVSGNYSETFLNASGCDSVSTLALTITPGVFLNSKVLLAGPYDANLGLMSDSLRQYGLIPTNEPYSSSPFNQTPIGEAGGESISTSITSVTGSDAIVDWVFLELRDASNPSIIIANKRALVQRDGDIVSHLDGVSPVKFATTYNGNYFVSVKHRNHLGVMSTSSILFNGCSISTVDFTSTSVYTNPLIANTPRKLVGAANVLWSADANNNKNVKYNGLSNDKDKILNAVGAGTPNATLSPVYRVEDLNMDGKLRYNNTDNDRALIINNVGVNTPNRILYQHTPN
ncbi:MAG TPA: hypothetical protein PLU17_13575, partial [Chitinophagaceae bacterium]|nr:hypothetical protein [Chitinophagaceae bacterium]